MRPHAHALLLCPCVHVGEVKLPVMPLTSYIPVLWPDDIKEAGYIYGWRKPLICVAGVLPLQTVCKSSYDSRPLQLNVLIVGRRRGCITAPVWRARLGPIRQSLQGFSYYRWLCTICRGVCST